MNQRKFVNMIKKYNETIHKNLKSKRVSKARTFGLE